MRSLSWKQPYADLMFHGKIETRTWATKYRGMVLIVASKVPYNAKQVLAIAGKQQYERIFMMFHPRNATRLPDSLYGHAIGIGELYACRPMHREDEDSTFVQYHPGLWCHVYRNVRRIDPFVQKGTMGWRGLTADQEKMVMGRVIEGQAVANESDQIPLFI